MTQDKSKSCKARWNIKLLLLYPQCCSQRLRLQLKINLLPKKLVFYTSDWPLGWDSCVFLKQGWNTEFRNLSSVSLILRFSNVRFKRFCSFWTATDSELTAPVRGAQTDSHAHGQDEKSPTPKKSGVFISDNAALNLFLSPDNVRSLTPSPAAALSAQSTKVIRQQNLDQNTDGWRPSNSWIKQWTISDLELNTSHTSGLNWKLLITRENQ